MKTILISLFFITLGVISLKLLEPSKTARPEPKEILSQPVQIFKKVTPDDLDKLKLVESYLDISGMAKNFSIPSLILEKHLKSPLIKARFTFDEIEKLNQFFEEKLGSDTIENFVKDQMIKNFNEDELKNLNEIYESSLMKKLRSIEEYFSSDEAMEKALPYLNDPENLKVSKNRMNLLGQLIEAQEADLSAKELTLESIKGLHRGMKLILPEKKQVKDEKANIAIKLVENTPTSNFKNTLLLRYQYLYQELSEIELIKLIKLSNNNLIRKARRASMTGIKMAFLSI